MARFTVGLVLGSARLDTGVKSLGVQKDGGPGLETALDLGGTLIDNLDLRARLRTGFFVNSNKGFGGDNSFRFSSVGLGGDYYFMPFNAYVGATLSITALSIRNLDDDHVLRGKAGPGLDLDVGKEWWISTSWGLGMSFRFTYLSIAPGEIAPESNSRLSVLSMSMLFSATCN